LGWSAASNFPEAQPGSRLALEITTTTLYAADAEKLPTLNVQPERRRASTRSMIADS